MVTEADYLEITDAQAQQQWTSIRNRLWVAEGSKQVDFTPVETLLCLGASFVISHRQFGSRTAHKAGAPVPELARLFKRPPSSILAKMANLDGSRRNGARHELLVGSMPEADPTWYGPTYKRLLANARGEGVGPSELPDFLGAEGQQSFQLLGQDELERSALEESLASEMARWRDRVVLDERETERLLVSRARIGQHRFANAVLHNCGHQCVFCGLHLGHPPPRRMLVASHIKPWRASSATERLDHLNGVAACPTHDVAFDTGLLMVDDEMRIVVAPAITERSSRDVRVAASFGTPPLAENLLLPAGASAPLASHFDWHRKHIYGAA